jgi:hypothetical protein
LEEEEARLEQEILEEEQRDVTILKKKIRKVRELMQEILDDKGESAGRKTKEYKKLQKKRENYAADFGRRPYG